MKTKKTFFFMIVFFAAVILSANAFSFVPMSASLTPSGTNSIMSFKVTNDTTQSIAVLIKVMTRTILLDGTEKNEPVGSEFIIFPTRVVVQPNSFQTIKVQYKGPQNLTREQCYRVIAEQVPIDFTKQETSGVKVLFRYIAALYVTPPKVSPKLVLTSAVGAEKDGKIGINVTISNEGTRHALLSNPTLRLQDSANTAMPIVISGEAVAPIDGQNLLPASQRLFFIHWDAAIPGVKYTGTFDAEIE